MSDLRTSFCTWTSPIIASFAVLPKKRSLRLVVAFYHDSGVSAETMSDYPHLTRAPYKQPTSNFYRHYDFLEKPSL